MAPTCSELFLIRVVLFQDIILRRVSSLDSASGFEALLVTALFVPIFRSPASECRCGRDLWVDEEEAVVVEGAEDRCLGRTAAPDEVEPDEAEKDREV